MTITEALAEVKLIDKKIEKKVGFIMTYLARQDKFKDPHERDGGSVKLIAQERQAIKDLNERKIRIRRAIASENTVTTIRILDQNRSVADWLTWRREVLPSEKDLLVKIGAYIENTRKQVMAKGISVGSASDAKTPDDVVVNINEKELNKDAEDLIQIEGELDGKLSLANATRIIHVE